jgi:hypothetical protein
MAQDPCNKSNVEKLLSGYPTEFYSRVQANDCLIKAKGNGIAGISVVPGKDKNSFGFVSDLGTRYLKLNKNDFFIGKTLLGKYKIVDKQEDQNKSMAKAKFIPKSCELSQKNCSAMTPPQNFNKDFCRCDPKETLYCGEKKWNLEKKSEAQSRCEAKGEFTWDEQSCECSEEKFCGDKKWSKKKKEKETESCLDKKGSEWDDNSCSCTEKLYCGDKKWVLAKLEKEESKCSEKENHIWNPDKCDCEIDSGKTVLCNGKPVDASKMKEEQKTCEEKSDSKTHYSWDEEKCSCQKEKITLVCGGETIGQAKYESKKTKCLERQTKDDRYSWDEEKCDCLKEENSKTAPLCGEKRMSQRKIDRKKSHCEEIKGEWDEQNCKCKDPCYEAEESLITEEEVCNETVPKLGDVAVAEIAAKVCEKAIPDSEKEKIKAKCQEEVEANYNQSPDKSGLKTIAIKIQYTSSEKVLCGENIVSVKNNQDLDHALPANVPTTDPSAFVGDCLKGGMKLNSTLNKYRPYGKITCDQIEKIKDANSDILKMANNSFDKFFSDLKIEGPVSAAEMDKILSTSNFNLQVIGTANRSNNGTGITLDALALKRKEEAERIIRAELMKKIQSKVVGGAYQVPNAEKLFTYNGLSQAVGPLNPAASSQSMHTVLSEPEAPAELKKCATKDGVKVTNTKVLFDCSVDYFVDKECPNLPQELQSKFCAGDKEILRSSLKAQKTADFLEDFKMFQVGVGMSAESKTPVYVDMGTIEVDCKADVTSEDVTETQTHITKMLKVTKPGFFRRLKKDCREERKELNAEYGKKNVRKAANHRKNPDGIVIEE